MRIYAAVGAILGWFALSLQLGLMIAPLPAGMIVLAIIIRYFSFFTILTNLLVAIVFSASAFPPNFRYGEFFRRPEVQTATAVYIAIVGAVYSLLLRHLWDPHGLQKVADVLLHDVVPVIYLLYWRIFVSKNRLPWKSSIAWLAYPLAYMIYTLVRGAISGDYPYEFIDVTQLGYPHALRNAAALLGVFWLTGMLAIALGRWMGRWMGPRSSAAGGAV